MEGSRAEEVLREAPQVVLCRVRTAEGREGILYGGSHSPLYRDELLGAISRRRRFSGERGTLVGSHTHAFRKIWEHDPSLESSLCKADQNGTSIKFGERFILKIFRRVETGTHPELEIGQLLTAMRERPHVPRLAGWLEYRSADGETLAAGAAYEYIGHETSAYQFTLDNLSVFFETALAAEHGTLTAGLQNEGAPPTKWERIPDEARTLNGSFLDLIALLGRRTAELHLALARGESTDFVPEPLTDLYRLGLYHALMGQKNRVFQQLRGSLEQLTGEHRGEAELLLGREVEIANKLQVLKDQRLGGRRIRVHGDFNLRQVLFTGKDFYIIDFEGEVDRALGERRIKRSPLRDLAGLLHSLYAASHGPIYGRIAGVAHPDAPEAVLESLAARWYRWSATEFLRGYLATAGVGDLLPSPGADLGNLLDALMLEHAMREIDQDLYNRPERFRADVHFIFHVLDDGGEDRAQP